VTVARDRRGEGIGPRLCAFVVDRASARGYDRARIAVNNPFAFEALSRAGFAFTGRETGIAELVLERPLDGTTAREDRAAAYADGLDRFRDRDRDLSAAERSFLRERAAAGDRPPATIDPPGGEG
jgi:GNAT superfamily N-acetyltransferase